MKHMTILQTPHGFILSQEPNFDPQNPKETTIEKMIPAIELKAYDYRGKSVLEVVEKFFTEPLTENA